MTRADRWRSVVLAPRGDGTTHRRGTDAVRLIVAVLAFLCCVLVIRVNARTELSLVSAIHPPPEGVRWLVATILDIGTFGVIVVLALLVLLARNRRAALDLAIAGFGTWALCGLSILVLGSSGGRPADPALAGINLGFPVVRLAVTMGVVTAALPYVARWVRRSVELAVFLAAAATVTYGAGLPVNVLGSLALGWGVTAIVHLALGSTSGLPSGAEVTGLLEELGVPISDVAPHDPQTWGAARFRGDGGSGPVDVTLYGRDARDAQLLAKLWRGIVYRDSGPTVALSRLQQVEHEAYATLLAERAGATVPEVVAAGSVGPSRDAVIVSRPPGSSSLADLESDVPGAEADQLADDLLSTMVHLRTARIAHGAVHPRTIAVDRATQTSGLLDFHKASTSAPPGRLDRDMAGALASLALAVGADRTVAAAERRLPEGVLAASLPHLQPAALDPIMGRTLRGQKAVLADLRAKGAASSGIEVPKLDEPRRVSWINLALALGTVVGGWALIGVLANVAASFGTIVGAKWGWVVATFFLAQAVYVANATELVGSITGVIPFGRAVALEVSNSFTSLAAGTMGSLAARVRFFQQQGYPASLAVSSGVLVSTASWIVKGALFLIALPLAIGTIHFHTEGAAGSRDRLIWLIVIIVVAVGLALGAVLVVPRLRRMARDKLRPKLADVLANLRDLARQPRKLAQIFGGCTASQLCVALALGAALHAFDDRLSLATLLVVLTLASMVGGVSPVPGGMGVVEAGMILLLTSAGVPQNDAVAAVFVQRLFTAYLPPIWGWFVLVWMRRREYL